MTTGTDFILNALVQEGLTHLFMVPGGLIDPFLPALARQPGLRPIVAAQEGGAAYMADGYARASGRFGAVVGIGGPGLGNMATAVAAAKTDASPVLALSGEIPVEMEGLGEFQDASQATLDDTSLMKPLTRLSATVTGPRTLNHWLRRALTTMWSEPRGPVHLSVTQDAMTGACSADYEPVFPYFKAAAPLSTLRAVAALERLAGRAKIAFLAGAGVEHAEAAAQLASIAERWSIPVATTLRAKGVFPEDHALSLGVFGYAGTRHATAAILDDPADALIVLGSGFNERDTMHWTLRGRTAGKTLVIQVDTNMESLTTHSLPGLAVPGDCRAFLDLMQERAAATGHGLAASEAERRAWVAAVKSGPRLYDVENCSRPGKPVHPAAAVAALRKVFPRDGVALVELGRAPRLRGPLLVCLRASDLYFRDQSRTDGLGDSGRDRSPVRPARPAGSGRHRRRLHADARARGADRGALWSSHHLRRAQQRRARQRLAARPQRRSAARRTHLGSGSRLGWLRTRARRGRFYRR